MYFVYLLRCSDESLYCGITNNLEQRFKAHQSGRGSKYARAKKAVEIVYVERKRNRSTATKREAVLKKLSRAEKLALIKTQAASKTSRAPAQKVLDTRQASIRKGGYS